MKKSARMKKSAKNADEKPMIKKPQVGRRHLFDVLRFLRLCFNLSFPVLFRPLPSSFWKKPYCSRRCHTAKNGSHG